MATPSAPEPTQAPSASPQPHVALPEQPSWFLRQLDSLISEELRRAPPATLSRLRFLVGAACFLLVFTLLYALSCLLSQTRVNSSIFACVGYAGTLVATRRARTLLLPAMFLTVTLSLGMLGGVFASQSPGGGFHATTMLVPALAVYLLGPRLGLLMTVAVTVALTVAYPIYFLHFGIAQQPPLAQLWSQYFFAGFSLLGAWWLGTLHYTAQDAAQRSLERTLKSLRESEGKLSSLVESTDDLVISLDRQGNVLTVNQAAKMLYQERFGIPLEPGKPLFPPAMEDAPQDWELRVAQVLQGKSLRFEELHPRGDTYRVLDMNLSPILGENGQTEGMTCFGRDVTASKEAEARLGEMHRSLVEVSRQAGMAEIATGVLHNVGNTLNSVNVSTSIVTDKLRQSRLNSLARATHLLREHAPDFTSFLSQDPQGRMLPDFLIALSDQLQEERESILQEMRSLSESVDHIKSVISMQQKHARAAGAVEQLSVPQLIDEALRLHAVSFERQGIRIERAYAQVPPILVDRHKLLQILINLLSNARHTLVASPREDKLLLIRVRSAPEGGRLHIEVQDNGLGIAPENLPRIFTQGFTTKKDGHGFGLHISALAATEMQGRLSCTSPGSGQGATFTLELPLEGESSPS